MSPALMKKTGPAAKTAIATIMGAKDGSPHRVEGTPISDRIMLAAEVRHVTGLSATTMWREIRAKRFPAAVTISPGRRGHLASEIEAWLQGRIAARNARAA